MFSSLTLGRVLIAGVGAAILGIGGFLAMPSAALPEADIRIEPTSQLVIIGDTFTVNVIVESSIPVNVFAGELLFDPAAVTIESISYNTSIADIWAERPWYSNGAGTLNFIGGTTNADGFLGEGTLLSITLKPTVTGKRSIELSEARILRHDGLGTDATLKPSVDAVFTVNNEQIERETVVKRSGTKVSVAIATKTPTTDLNGDGKQSLADVSIFMQTLITQDPIADFNGDGKINTADLSILLEA